MKGKWLIICIVMQSKHLWALSLYIGVLGSQEDCVFKENLAKPPPPPPLHFSSCQAGARIFCGTPLQYQEVTQSRRRAERLETKLPCDLKAPHAESRNSMRSTKDPQDKTVQVATALKPPLQKSLSPHKTFYSLCLLNLALEIMHHTCVVSS